MKYRIELLMWPLNKLWSGHKLAKNVSYGDGDYRKLDVYGGRKSKKNRPVIIFWLGGAWQHGKKEDYQFVGSYLSRHGVVVIPSYPLYPHQTYPGFLSDAEQVVAWVKQNISGYGGNPSSIYIVGHSAGAHTACALAIRGDTNIKGCVGLGTPATISAQRYDKIFNGQLRNGSALLVNLIDKEVPARFLMFQGTIDQIVSVDDAKKIEGALLRHGNDVKTVYLGGFEHFGILQAVGSPLGRFLKTHRILAEFIT